MKNRSINIVWYWHFQMPKDERNWMWHTRAVVHHKSIDWIDTLYKTNVPCRFHFISFHSIVLLANEISNGRANTENIFYLFLIEPKAFNYTINQCARTRSTHKYRNTTFDTIPKWRSKLTKTKKKAKSTHTKTDQCWSEKCWCQFKWYFFVGPASISP